MAETRAAEITRLDNEIAVAEKASPQDTGRLKSLRAQLATARARTAEQNVDREGKPDASEVVLAQDIARLEGADPQDPAQLALKRNQLNEARAARVARFANAPSAAEAKSAADHAASRGMRGGPDPSHRTMEAHRGDARVTGANVHGHHTSRSTGGRFSDPNRFRNDLGHTDVAALDAEIATARAEVKAFRAEVPPDNDAVAGAEQRLQELEGIARDVPGQTPQESDIAKWEQEIAAEEINSAPDQEKIRRLRDKIALAQAPMSQDYPRDRDGRRMSA